IEDLLKPLSEDFCECEPWRFIHKKAAPFRRQRGHLWCLLDAMRFRRVRFSDEPIQALDPIIGLSQMLADIEYFFPKYANKSRACLTSLCAFGSVISRSSKPEQTEQSY